MNYFYLINLDILWLGIGVAANALLALAVFLNNRQNTTNRAFLFFAILTICWSVTNFLVSRSSAPSTTLWLLRFAVFFATWHAFSFFHLFYVFPRNKITYPRMYALLAIPIVLITSLLTLTPLVFKQIATFSNTGQAASAVNGPAIVLFGAVIVMSILGGLLLMIKKMAQASGMEKLQLKYIFTGAFITFLLLLTFNFILPAFFNNARFVSFGALFILPFAFFTAYAIIRHHLLNIKMIATEILTFVLASASIIEVVVARDIGTLILRISIFLLLLIFGILLIKSVRKEIGQKEELQRAYAKLKELDEAKSEFVSITSHQLRTPLTAIKGYISMILEEAYGPLAEKQKQPMRNVYESNERLIQLVNDLLDISRIESGKTRVELKTGQLYDVVKTALEELRIKAKDKRLKLIFEKPSADMPEFQFDAVKIRNVIMNIVDNAIKYTGKGSIRVSLAVNKNKIEHAGNALITIQDTGEGMSKEEINHLFESFSRGNAGNKFWTEGSGLGLYIAKQFVVMHKGRIWAESEGKGKGSAFFVELPLV
ncbi:MAG: hypothetical protein HY482_02695 [Candidatus Wildermuthbacteria bacterium]|nr:hypothetical protein [Candidatus Wildermuthbacteria bacterium]